MPPILRITVTMSSKPRTLFEKIWDNHVVLAEAGLADGNYVPRGAA